MKKRKRNLIKDTKGAGGEIYTVIFFLAFFIIALFVIEYVRALIIVQGVRDAAQTAIITAATENWDDTYKGRRDGYSGAWHKSFSQEEAAAFTERIDRQDIATIMNGIIGSSSVGNFNQKVTGDGSVEFRYRITNMVWEHQTLRPGSPLSKHFQATVTINIQIPWGFNWTARTPIDLNIRVKAIYVPKF